MTSFWHLAAPFGEERYAEAISLRASMERDGLDWTKPHSLADHLAEERSVRRAYPMVIEWQPGSDVVAEFIWHTVGLVVWRAVAEELAAAFPVGVDVRPIEMTQDPKLARPTRPTKRSKPRVRLPYEGPELAELVVEHWAEVDLEASDVEVREDACRCGYSYWKPLGVARTGPIRGEDGEERFGRLPRDGTRGLRVRSSELGAAGLFRLVSHHRDWVLVTEEVKAHIEARGWRNVDFVELGDIVAG